MQLPSLLGHAAELFRIIRKSPQPADALASDYFRSKKYIGSKERRFLSEAVFAALRTMSAAGHCAAAGLRAVYEQAEAGQPNDESAPVDIVAAACLLGERLGAMNSTDVLSAVPGNAVGDETALCDALAQAWARATERPPEDGAGWCGAVREAWERLDTDATRIAGEGPANDEELGLLAVRCCVQPWMLKAWRDDPVHGRSWREVAAVAQSLIPSAPLCLRVNTMLMTRDEALRRLADQGVEAEPGAVSPAAVVCRRRVDIRRLDLVTGGALEVQDEASQLVAYAVAPEEDWTVLDACAGAGGKSLHLAVEQHDRGTVVASDIEFRRLKEIASRARRSGLSSIRVVPLPRSTRSDGEPPAELARYRDRCDAVVVDAPCSGMGTVRRMPLPKWRLTPELLARHTAKQRGVLATYAQCVRPGGVLVYSTCSIMPQENDEVVQAFLADHPEFEREPVVPLLERQGVRITKAAGQTLTLTPSEHGTDGFFIARMRRTGGL